MRFFTLLSLASLIVACKKEGTKSHTAITQKDTVRYSEINHKIAPEYDSLKTVAKDTMYIKMGDDAKVKGTVIVLPGDTIVQPPPPIAKLVAP